MKIIFSALILAFFLAPGISSAQLEREYTKGTVLFQDGHEVQGLVREDEPDEMYFKIHFKAAVSDRKDVAYDTTAIHRVSLENGEILELLPYRDRYMKTDARALGRLLVRGKASLYRIVLKGRYMYAIKRADKIYLLKQDRAEHAETYITKYYFRFYLISALEDWGLIKTLVSDLPFGESNFVKLVTEYNQSLDPGQSTGLVNKIINTKAQLKHFVLIGGSGMTKQASNQKELLLQFTYRTYFLKISRGTSVNIGLNYFHYTYETITYPNKIDKHNGTLVSLPLQIQENILSGRFRPYFFVGVNLSYMQERDGMGVQRYEKGFQSDRGFNILGGAGIELNVTKAIILKAEYRYENMPHLIMVGLQYVL